jgi:succinate dehydrogenase/fumarate reductase flavoprotein subunit
MRLWDRERQDLPGTHDVIVVGSGAGGLRAAAAAADAGLSVAVLEKSGLFGGTSAVSAGTIWVPGNPYMNEAGLVDDPALALRYLEQATAGKTPPALLRRLVETGPEMLEFARSCGLELDVAAYFPDYRQDFAGAMPGARSLQPRLFDRGELGPLRDALRFDTNQLPYTMGEFKQWGSWEAFPWEELRGRAERGIVGRGAALVGPLLAFCLARGVRFASEARVTSLLTSETGGNKAVTGVEVDGRRLRSARGVVLACGGFEWDREMVAEHVRGEIEARCSPPHNTGDGHRMAAAAGASFANMSEAWWAPMGIVPGQEIDGEQIGRHLRTERQGPGTIIVDRHGRRFVNESQDYNSLIRAAHRADRESGPHLPMYVVFDQRFLDRYGFITYRSTSGQPVPDWLLQAESAGGLAGRLGMDPGTLQATLDRFNAFAVEGKDEDFGRGQNIYDVYGGDAANPYPNPNLAPVTEGPFYAMQVMPGAFGTSGGVRTDDRGRALAAGDTVIAGLYAVGNVSSHPCAAGYPGAGATLGPAMTMGYAAAREIARTARETSGVRPA